ncbi:hypothetical protein [Oceanobacillus oncorhynchi]|uniref:hypothetical protein n=1 Tax=Oceanobacillus oncorhynchi TaxID=545501 RepID=UPI001867D167|nr:hypothetical protein [Oceanobacillus oncorhynchi]
MEQVNITYVTPEMYGYKDRGILKWQGMILADQKDAMKIMKDEFEIIEAKEEMSEEEISKVLHKAYTMDCPIAIQANAMRNGSYYKDVLCKIAGYGNGRIFLNVIDGRKTSCTIDQIRNVEFMDTLDWYDKRK